ncbi:uncharacterized protein [Mycetomoellerius zeteki]|uniref:uncharacterized protein n=1 Tax=Mycetomoellerius zeteki TaxID=64791 RepID=UPI00084EB80D|nr:PREDICTED: uncharacterized protein LOC108727787 [Trachymyrmex zeteki]
MPRPPDAVEKRWLSLRDMFSREARKKLLPSGSGYQPKKEWELYKMMLFLSPHIAHRRTKTSLPCRLSCLVPSETEINNSSSFDGSVPSPIADYDNIESEKENNIPNENEVIITVDYQSESSRPPSVLSSFSCSSNSSNISKIHFPRTSNFGTQNAISSPFKNIKSVTPELDTFAKRRKQKDLLIDQQLSEASSAISHAVQSISSYVLNENKSGYMLAIEEGIKYIPDKHKTQYFIDYR